MIRVLSRIAVCVIALLSAGLAQAQERPVDVELVLAVDGSASISGNALDFQLQGHAEAFRNPQLVDAILSGPHKAVAVTLVQWSGPGMVQTLVPWTALASTEDLAVFANAVAAAPRSEQGGSTAVGSALMDIAPLFQDNGFAGEQKTIDLVSNGFSNSGVEPGLARDQVAGQGITVNALVILDEYPWLEEYYRENVIGGFGAFVRAIESAEDFTDTLLGKLLDEIVSVPQGLRQVLSA